MKTIEQCVAKLGFINSNDIPNIWSLVEYHPVVNLVWLVVLRLSSQNSDLFRAGDFLLLSKQVLRITCWKREDTTSQMRVHLCELHRILYRQRFMHCKIGPLSEKIGLLSSCSPMSRYFSCQRCYLMYSVVVFFISNLIMIGKLVCCYPFLEEIVVCRSKLKQSKTTSENGCWSNAIALCNRHEIEIWLKFNQG